MQQVNSPGLGVSRRSALSQQQHSHPLSGAEEQSDLPAAKKSLQFMWTLRKGSGLPHYKFLLLCERLYQFCRGFQPIITLQVDSCHKALDLSKADSITAG